MVTAHESKEKKKKKAQTDIRKQSFVKKKEEKKPIPKLSGTPPSPERWGEIERIVKTMLVSGGARRN